MRYLNYAVVSLASALVATYAVLWFIHPTPLENTVTLPPLSVLEQPDGLLLWGGWRTVAGYEPPGTNAVEIRCVRTQNTCTEAYASLLQHDTGLDLVAEVFSYEVISWSETQLEAVAKGAMAGCDRALYIDLVGQGATMKWLPGEDCEGDMTAAVLVGDPV
ncbi:hypothetical protein [Pseudomonas benzenivorans]|uniref:Uncharacterized protein n=1 Tax=Pseudomonas benzenivorans TaxID=556533 RepID=A0ABY5H9D1_9PSED|nr:hypothetical protein [Pseudomonas benzenivorans]UTW07997.1 hypothetical protein KDW96_01275 [Pseudomonas benzenivorans]